MKFIKNLGLALLALFAIYLIYDYITAPKPPTPPDYAETIQKLEKEKSDLKNQELNLIQKNDSLLSILGQVNNKISKLTDDISQKENQINQLLAGDSSKALQLNREALREAGVQISTAPYLTNFEMGWNAKFINELSGMRLKVFQLEDYKLTSEYLLALKDKIIFNKSFQLAASDSLAGLWKSQTDFYKNQFDETQSFFYDRFVIYAGVGVNYSDKLIPGLQLGIGIKIIPVKF